MVSGKDLEPASAFHAPREFGWLWVLRDIRFQRWLFSSIGVGSSTSISSSARQAPYSGITIMQSIPRDCAEQQNEFHRISDLHGMSCFPLLAFHGVAGVGELNTLLSKSTSVSVSSLCIETLRHMSSCQMPNLKTDDKRHVDFR